MKEIIFKHKSREEKRYRWNQMHESSSCHSHQTLAKSLVKDSQRPPKDFQEWSQDVLGFD